MSERDERDPTSLCKPACLIGDVFPGHHIADMHDACAQLDDGKHWIGRTGCRIYPEERRACAYEVEMALRIKENGGGTGQ